MKKIDNRGFTLIELIVVITIIGILVGMSIPNIMKIKHRASVEIDIANRENLKNAVSLAILDGNILNESITWDSNDDSGWVDYIDKWPKYPLDNSKEYSVEVSKKENDWITIIKPEINEEDKIKK